MIVRLQNLSARPPKETDLEAVTALLIVCDMAESGISDFTKEDVREIWQTPGFSLKNDSWVITTYKGQIVGYADVRQGRYGQFATTTLVHPNYRGRGIGTLLTWLVEERARQLAYELPADMRVTLSNSISCLDIGARQLLEREGYTQARSYWRLVIELDESGCAPDNQREQPGKLKVNLMIDPHTTLATARAKRRTGLYIARQYDVFEKVLRIGNAPEIEPELQRERVGA